VILRDAIAANGVAYEIVGEKSKTFSYNNRIKLKEITIINRTY
jgi:hypothetical protein